MDSATFTVRHKQPNFGYCSMIVFIIFSYLSAFDILNADFLIYIIIVIVLFLTFHWALITGRWAHFFLSLVSFLVFGFDDIAAWSRTYFASHAVK